MTSPPATSHGVEVHRYSVELPLAELVAALRETLGTRLVAYLGGVADPKAVRQWAAGTRRPSQAVEHRLRLAYQLAAVIGQTSASPSIVQAWFQGANPALKDWSPARTLVDFPVDEISAVVLRAARAFAGTAQR
jgi:hypothetical protein